MYELKYPTRPSGVYPAPSVKSEVGEHVCVLYVWHKGLCTPSVSHFADVNGCVLEHPSDVDYVQSRGILP